jgi:cytochrome c biogenesis protein CcmG/thiol:disulfide interchange protein DsbE
MITTTRALTLSLALLLPSSGEAKPLRTGETAPVFELEVLAGNSDGKLISLRGQVVVIEFWATYCGWCKATHPTLAALDRENRHITVLGISAQKKSRIRRYLYKKKPGFVILHDYRRKVSRAYAATATPTLVVIDQKGRLRYWGQGKPAALKAKTLATRLAQRQ